MQKVKNLFFIFISVFAFVSCKSKMKVEKRPNVLIILTDDQEINEIAKFGAPALTPNMDMIANEGIVLDRFYVNSPVCSPSRYSLLTGRYSSRNKNIESLYPKTDPAFIRWNTDILPGKEETIASILKANGYSTGMVGKWHLGQPLPESTYFETNQLDPKNPEVAKRIKSFYEGMRQYVKEATGFEYVESLYGNNLHAIGLPASIQQHNMDWVTKGALDFFQQYNPEKTGKPFFLYYAPTAPHIPDQVISMRSDPRITAEGLLDKSIDSVQPSRENVFKRVKGAGFEESTAPLTWLDDGIGSLLSKLKEMGSLENTLIIFMSDNGSHHGKMTCYDIAAHMPAMIMWKGKIAPGSHLTELTANTDILPTILDACQIKKPGKYKTDGISLLPAILKKQPLKRDFLYLEVVYQRSIITEKWQYIATRFPPATTKKINSQNRNQYSIEGEKQPDRYEAEKYFPGYFDDDQLYYLPDDPGEQNNLATNPANNETLKNMKDKLSTVVGGLYNSFGEFGK